MSAASRAVVTRLEFDVEGYQGLAYDLPDPGLELWTFDGTPRTSDWSPYPVYVGSPRLKEPDIWHLWGAAVLVLTSETIEALEPFVTTVGELLPLRFVGGARDGTTLYALNVLQDVNCLDPALTDRSDPSLRRLAFIGHRLPETGLFKVPELDTVEIFHVERDDDSDSFRRRIERLGLEGVSFTTVWDSETGTVPVDLFPFGPEHGI